MRSIRGYGRWATAWNLTPLAASLCIAVAVPAARPVAAAAPEVQVRLVAPARLAAGAKGTVAVEMELGRGWHVNSHMPSHEYLVPTTLDLTASSGTLSAVRYPSHVARRFEFADEPIAVYDGAVRFEAELAVPESAGGEIVVDAVLGYQACDDHQCYPPARKTLTTAVPVVGRRSRVR